MTCEEARAAAWAALDAELDVPGAAALERHLAGCAECRMEAAATARVAAAFVASPAPPAPPELLARLGLADAVHVPAPGPAVLAAAPVQVPVRPQPRAWWASAWPIASGVVAAALIAVVGLNVRPPGPEPSTLALASPSPAAIEEPAEGDAILSWFGPEADPVEPW